MRWKSAVAACAALLDTACAHGRSELPAELAAAAFRLGREDVVEVAVYRDAELSRVVVVRPDGRISLPIVGEVDAAGRTPEDVKGEIVTKLRGYVQDPTVVSLIVREVNSARFYVVGEVVKPGAFPLRGHTSVLQALALAGGLGEFSARREVTLVRAADGRRYSVELGRLWDGHDTVVLAPGDTLVVP
jgi:polysaccharide export outer membrane protein